MRGFVVTLRRELASLWLRSHAWALLVALLILQGVTLSSIVTSFAEGVERVFESGPLEAFYGHSVLLPLAYVFICPALTMRSFAEERRSGTIENLLCAPVSLSGVVLGKYTASFVSFVLLWLPSVAYPLILSQVTEVDWRVVCATYLGIFGLAAGSLAIGVLFSAVTRSQFLALVLTAGSLVILLLLGVAEQSFGDGLFHEFCEHIAIQQQLVEMSQGIISLRRVVFDITLTALPLFVATRIVDSWRWR